MMPPMKNRPSWRVSTFSQLAVRPPTYGECSRGHPAGERSSDLSRSLGAEQQEQEHASIVLTTLRRRTLECRLTRVPCRRDDRRRRSRDSPSGVAPGTQREQGNENMDGDETELPGPCQATSSLAPHPWRAVRIYGGMKT